MRVRIFRESESGKQYLREHSRNYHASEEMKITAWSAYLIRHFGITPIQYQAMFEAQGEVCAICQQGDSSGRRLAVDHDHQTGRVRGLLCWACNTTLGHLRESASTLERAIKYLRNAAAYS
jgi:hypothetical protein